MATPMNTGAWVRTQIHTTEPDVRQTAAARTSIAASAAVAETGVKMPQLDALNVAPVPAGETTPVAAVAA